MRHNGLSRMLVSDAIRLLERPRLVKKASLHYRSARGLMTFRVRLKYTASFLASRISFLLQFRCYFENSVLPSGPSVIHISQDQGPNDLSPNNTSVVPDDRIKHRLQVLPSEVTSRLFGKVTLLVLKTALIQEATLKHSARECTGQVRESFPFALVFKRHVKGRQ